MQQADLNRAVARATGETVSTIKQLGFSFEEIDELDGDPTVPLVMDWDAYDAQRAEHWIRSTTYESLAA